MPQTNSSHGLCIELSRRLGHLIDHILIQRLNHISGELDINSFVMCPIICDCGVEMNPYVYITIKTFALMPFTTGDKMSEQADVFG